MKVLSRRPSACAATMLELASRDKAEIDDRRGDHRRKALTSSDRRSRWLRGRRDTSVRSRTWRCDFAASSTKEREARGHALRARRRRRQVLPEVGPELGQYGRKHRVPRHRGLPEDHHAVLRRPGHVVLTSNRARGGQKARTPCVWTAGVKPNPGSPLALRSPALGPRGHVAPGHSGSPAATASGARGRRRPDRRTSSAPQGGQRQSALVPAERAARHAPGQGRSATTWSPACRASREKRVQPQQQGEPSRVSACTRASR